MGFFYFTFGFFCEKTRLSTEHDEPEKEVIHLDGGDWNYWCRLMTLAEILYSFCFLGRIPACTTYCLNPLFSTFLFTGVSQYLRSSCTWNCLISLQRGNLNNVSIPVPRLSVDAFVISGENLASISWIFHPRAILRERKQATRSHQW